MPALSQAVRRTDLAATFAMAARARALRAAGKDVISLSLGEPDFPTPPHAIAAAHAAALNGETKYPPLTGTAALKEAIRAKFLREQGLDYALEQILVTNGGKQAIFNVVMAVIDPGDEVLIPSPAWAGYEQAVRLAGGIPVFIPCPAETGFVLQPAALAAAITPRTRLLILNYPNNPSGAACDAAGLGAIAEVLRRHPEVWVLSDDIYEQLLFDDLRFTTLAAVAPDLADRIVTMSGVSKTYAMTGWRVGYCAGPLALIKACTIVQATATSGVSGLAQAAAAAALNGPQEYLADRRAAYQARRDIVVERLAAVPGLACGRPQGAFYVFPSVAGCIGKTTPAGVKLTSDEDFAMALLEEGLVAVVQGAAFAMSPYVRISTAASDASLREACARIADFCGRLT